MKELISYWWTIPLFFWYAAYGIASKINQDAGQDGEWSWKWFGIMMIFGLCPLWAIISRYSKNLIYDGMIYDLIILIGVYGGMVLMGAGQNFSTPQWIGTIFVLVGLVIIKVF